MSETTQDQSTVSVGQKRRKGRSPSYPGITLQTAIKRAQEFYDRDKTHETPISVVTKGWGYSSHTTGPASVTYAALIKYGLMSDEGSGDGRVAKLTPLAVTILMTPDATERQAAIRAAALKPAIIADIWHQYGAALPSDESLRYKMAIQGPFTESGFDDFLRVYKDVVTFAKLQSAEKIDDAAPIIEDETDPDDDVEEEKPPVEQRSLRVAPRTRGGGVTAETQTVAVPMIGQPAVMVEGKFPLTEHDWNYFLAVLTAMKPGLVAEADDPDAE